MHENLFVRQICFQHASMRVSHLYRQRILVQLEHSNVFQLVAFFFAHVNLASGKLVDHLIAPKKGHRIARGQIENSTTQFFLRSGRSLHVKPQTDYGANNGDRAQWNADAGDAHAVGTQRDQFVVCREPSEHEEDRRQQSPGNSKDEGERQHVGDERNQVFHRHIVVHQQRKKFPKNISDHEHQAQHRDREQHAHDQLAANESIDQLHFPGQILTQVWQDERRGRPSVSLRSYQNPDNLLN